MNHNLREDVLRHCHFLDMNSLQFARRMLSLNPFEKVERAVLRSEIAAAWWVVERECLLSQI